MRIFEGRLTLFISLLGAVLCLAGCFPSNMPPPAGDDGFFVFSEDVLLVGGVPENPTPHPGAIVSGTWSSDTDPNSFGAVKSFMVETDDQGQDFIVDGRYPANWITQVTWNPTCGGQTFQQAIVQVTFAQRNITWACAALTSAVISPSFVLTGSFPGTISVTSPGFSSSYGMPQMAVYAGTTLISTTRATSITGGGAGAVFTFPTAAGSSPLNSGFYTYSLANETSTGSFGGIGVGYFSVGSRSTAQVTPSGVDAFDSSSSTETCVSSTCTTSSASSGTGYLETLATPNEVCLSGLTCVVVGANPVAVKAYDPAPHVLSSSESCIPNPAQHIIICTTTVRSITEPSRAITANYGSNNVTIVNVPSMTVSATLAVGTQPVALAVDSTQTYAYVANYGSSSITKINLATQTVAGTLAVGAAPATLSLDPGGSFLWVGGLNYITKVSLSNFAVASTTSVSGQVTALGISAAQNSWVFTSISSDLSTFNAQDVSISNPTTIHSESTEAIAGTFFSGTGTTTTPPPYLKSSVVVTSGTGNGVAITSSPTGFVVIDLVTHAQIMQGTTPSPVRGIAIDPSQKVGYLTAPESNSLITVPLPASE